MKLVIKAELQARAIIVTIHGELSKDVLHLPLSAQDFDRVSKIDVTLAQTLYLVSNLAKQVDDNLDGSQFSEDDIETFELEDLMEPALSFRDGKLRIAYKTVAAVRFGNLDQSVGLNESHLNQLKIPPYTQIRARLSSDQNFHDANFRLSLTLFTQYMQSLEFNSRTGHLYKSPNADEAFLTPSLHRLLLRMEEHEKVIKTESYRKSPARRKREFSEVKRLAIKANVLLEEFVRQENVVFLETLPYILGRSPTDEVVLAPALPVDLNNYDSELQRVLAEHEGEERPDFVNLKLASSGDKIRVAFSEVAWERHRKIKALNKAGQAELEKIIQDPPKFFDGQSPRVLVGGTFSDRVTGFIFGKLSSNKSDSESNTDWAEGMSDLTAILRSTTGSSFPIHYLPTPDVYEELKRSYTHLEKEIERKEEETRADLGAFYTPLPQEPELTLHIPSLNADFKLSEIHTCCRRIEAANRVQIHEDEIPAAMEVVASAKLSNELVVNWGNTIEGLKRVIPLKSLIGSIPELVPERDNRIVSPALGAKRSEVGIAPDWDWNSCNLDDFKSPNAFKDQVTLQPHQRLGYAWLRWLFDHRKDPDLPLQHRGALLADDMGLGKTIQVLALITHVRTQEQFANRPILIVAPLSLIKTSWIDEGFKKFVNESFLKLNETSSEENALQEFSACPYRPDRQLLIAEATKVDEEMKASNKRLSDCEISSELKAQLSRVRDWCQRKIIITSYETMRINSLALGSINFSLVILDEAQKIKNIGVLQSNAAKALKADMHVAMTGTPIENSLMDLWAIMDFVCPGHLGPSEDFRKNYLTAARNAAPGSPERENLKSALLEELAPMWFRRTKTEVFRNTDKLKPINHYDNVVLDNGTKGNKHLVKMSDVQRAIYEESVGHYNQAQAGHRLAAIQELLIACSAPWLRTGDSLVWANKSRLFTLCRKLESALSILDSIRNLSDEEGRKVIIFANRKDIANGLAFFIFEWNKATSKDSLEVEVYNGDASQEKRDQMLGRFKTGKGFQVIIISPKAGGAGLNIAEANHVIHYTREWNPALEKQATDRVYRIGQERSVHVYYPTSGLGDPDKVSGEEHLANILKRKRDLMEDFTISPADHSLSESEMDSAIGSNAQANVRIHGRDLAQLDPGTFELLVACVYAHQGYETYRVGKANDSGGDVVCIGQDLNVLIQVKHTQTAKYEGTKGINEVRGAKSVYEASWNKTFALHVATNSRFSEQAITHSTAGERVILIGFAELNKLLERFPVTYDDLRRKRAQVAPVTLRRVA